MRCPGAVFNAQGRKRSLHTLRSSFRAPGEAAWQRRCLVLWRLAILGGKILDLAWVQWQLWASRARRQRLARVLRLWRSLSSARRQGLALLGAWRVVVALAPKYRAFRIWCWWHRRARRLPEMRAWRGYVEKARQAGWRGESPEARWSKRRVLKAWRQVRRLVALGV